MTSPVPLPLPLPKPRRSYYPRRARLAGLTWTREFSHRYVLKLAPILEIKICLGPGWAYWINGEMGRDEKGEKIFCESAEEVAQIALRSVREALPKLAALLAGGGEK